MGRIERLSEEVVHRIAAGEILHRPFNAVKELLENSLDAGATSISITCKEGGLKFLQIQDNGHGIAKDDLEIVCERFTTSKLKTFEDLQSIQTFGFRGEALASISHVARLTITTKTADSTCAFKGFYHNGKLAPLKPGTSSDPKACAGNTGTSIVVEDLFYNIPTRRKAFKNVAEEYQKIVDVVIRYAIHYPHVSFICRKLGGNATDVSTKASATSLDIIKQIYPSGVSKELLPIETTDDQTNTKFTGYISNANYSVKRLTFILLINHRVVESNTIKKAVEVVYSRFLPKGTHPWVYISLDIPPHRVDVNVHPTKKEVHFLDEDGVLDHLVQILNDTLGHANTSRTFTAPKPISHAVPKSFQSSVETPRHSSATPFTHINSRQDIIALPVKRTVTELNHAAPLKTPKPSSSASFRAPEHKLVRTDPRTRTLDSYLSTPGSSDTPRSISSKPVIQTPSQTFADVQLTSVLELRAEYKLQKSEELCDIMRQHTFVGCFDNTKAFIQFKTKLLLVDYQYMSHGILYEMVLDKFDNFNTIQLDHGVSVRELLQIALDFDSYGVNQKVDIEEALHILESRGAMLEDYFSILIRDDHLEGLPELWEDYRPNMTKLPAFMLKLVTEVNMMEEQQCFKDMATVLAWFYVPEPEEDGEVIGDEEWQVNYRWIVEHIVFTSFRKLTMTKSMLDVANEITELESLYRIFERC